MFPTSIEAKLRKAFPQLEITVETFEKCGLWEAELEASLPGCHKFVWRNLGRSEHDAVERVFANAYLHYAHSPAYQEFRRDRARGRPRKATGFVGKVHGIEPNFFALK